MRGANRVDDDGRERFWEQLCGTIEVEERVRNNTTVTTSFLTLQVEIITMSTLLLFLFFSNIRVSVGLEHIDDIKADFDQAIAKALHKAV